MSVADTGQKLSKPPKKRSVWRWIFWIFLVLLCLILIIPALIWGNRFSLMEQLAEDFLLEQGIKAELSIESVTRTQAILKNVRLSDGEVSDGTAFFEAEKITTDYEWREAIKGRVEKIVFLRPQARLTLDDKGKIIDGWLPPQGQDEGGEAVLPPKGILIKDGTFMLGSPFGEALAKVDATYFARDNFTAKLDIAPTRFSYVDWRMAGGGQFDIDLKGDNQKIDMDISLSTLEHPVIDAVDLDMRGSFVPVISGDDIRVDGDIDFKFDSLITAQIMSGAGSLKWDGAIEHNRVRAHPLILKGEWSSKAENLIVPDPARRRSLAETLSLSRTLSKAPIAQNFSSQLTQKMTSLLERSDIEASGRIDLNAKGLSVSLSGPAILQGDETRLRLEQTDWAPVYNFSRSDEELRLAFHAALTVPAGLSFREADLVAPSKNGWQLEGVKRFSADISTSETWRSKGLGGGPARLAPFKAETVYKGGEGPRNILLSGDVNYDGTIPGGYATGLKTAGRMTMDLRGPAMSVRFKPKGNAPIKIARLETDIKI